MRPFIKTILLITLIAGTLDILAAIIHISINTGNFPNRIFQGIASGMVGRETAFAGGVATHILGFLIHYFIAFSFTLFYFLIYPYVGVLGKNKIVSGVVYGWFIWAVMNLVVLPYMSTFPRRPFDWPNDVVGLIVLPLVVGVPIAIGAEKYYRNKIRIPLPAARP
jgi:Protein of unknown function (DUF1440).